jgi:hypothetical protein
MRRTGLIAFFVLTFGYTWGVGLCYGFFGPWMAAVFGPVSFGNPLIFAAVWSPTISGLLMSYAFGGWAGLRDLIGRLLRFRVGVRWYAIAVGGTAVIELAARYVESLREHVAAPPLLDFAHYPQMIQYGLVTMVLDPGPLGEDLGWRGFAMPRMLARMSPLSTALVLGVIWGTWHVPAFLVPGLPQNEVPIHWFMLSIVSVSVLMTWIALHTRGSVVPLVLMHWAVNRFSDLGQQGAMYCASAYMLAALAVILATRGRLGPAGAAALAPSVGENRST